MWYFSINLKQLQFQICIYVWAHTHIYIICININIIVCKYTYMCVFVLLSFFVILTRTGITCYVEASFEDLPSSDWPVCLSVGHFLGWSLIEKGQTHCEWRHIWTGGLGYIRRQIEQARGSNPITDSIHGLCFVSCLGPSVLEPEGQINISSSSFFWS